MMQYLNKTLLRLIAGSILLFLTLSTPVFAQSDIDLHWFWDDRCESCHGHSADFAHQYLQIAEGKLSGQHHVDDLRLFLRNHYLSEQLVDEVYAMLSAQVTQPQKFRDKCAACHQSASIFVRKNLRIRNDSLIVRGSGEAVRKFLENHRRLSDDDIDFYATLLTRVAREVKAFD